MPLTLEQRILALAQTMGTELKATRNLVGVLSALGTTSKNSVVDALNEVLEKLNKVDPSDIIKDGDTSGAKTTYSIDKITALIASMRADLLSTISGGITDTTLDTLKEIADFLKGNAAGGLVDSLSKRVSVSGAQSFDAAQQKTGRDNIGAAAAADLTALSSAIGNPDKDFAGAFTAALT